MPAVRERPFPDPPPACAAEISGRAALALALIALAFALCALREPPGENAGALEGLMLPRMGAFVLAALVAGLIQGARLKNLVLLAGALLATLSAFILQTDPPGDGAALRLAHDLGLLETSLLAAVLWGTWLGRGLSGPGHLLAVVLCASAGDAWINLSQVPQSVGETHPLRLLRLGWPPGVGALGAAPSLLDMLFLSLYLEAARRLRFHMLSVVLGALAGYAAASLLSLATLRVMLALPLVGLGVLLGAWPEFRCTGKEVLLAFALAVALFLALKGFGYLRQQLHPEPVPRPPPFQLKLVAQARENSSAWSVERRE